MIFKRWHPLGQCSQKILPNLYESCPKMISLEKWMILTPLQKLPVNEGNLGKIIVATSFECLSKSLLPNLVSLLSDGDSNDDHLRD